MPLQHGLFDAFNGFVDDRHAFLCHNSADDPVVKPDDKDLIIGIVESTDERSAPVSGIIRPLKHEEMVIQSLFCLVSLVRELGIIDLISDTASAAFVKIADQLFAEIFVLDFDSFSLRGMP